MVGLLRFIPQQQGRGPELRSGGRPLAGGAKQTKGSNCNSWCPQEAVPMGEKLSRG